MPSGFSTALVTKRVRLLSAFASDANTTIIAQASAIRMKPFISIPFAFWIRNSAVFLGHWDSGNSRKLQKRKKVEEQESQRNQSRFLLQQSETNRHRRNLIPHGPSSGLKGITLKKRKFVILAAVIVLIAAWYAFRPERLIVSKSVHEEFPSAQNGSPAETLESGRFRGVVHPTEGTATVYRMADGSHVLRLTNFKTTNGPDVHVYMVAADDAPDSKTVRHANFIDLGTIKGNIGDQNYRLGPEVDLARYRTVSIWCKRFSVNFGAAALRANQKMSREQGHLAVP
ncbi:MAG TPA: DM13 domain-containing protein [Candidatus Angelobacter sp.]